MIEELAARRTKSEWARSEAPDRPRSASRRQLAAGGVVAAALVIGIAAIALTRSAPQSSARGLVPTASATEALGETRAPPDLSSMGATAALEVDAAATPKASASEHEAPRAPANAASASTQGAHAARPVSPAAASGNSKAKPTAKPAKSGTDFGY